MGVIGFLTFLFFIGFIIYKAVILLNRRSLSIQDKNIALGMILISLSIVIGGVFDQMFERGDRMFIFWFLLAVLLNIQAEAKQIKIPDSKFAKKSE